ncbi:E3 ubiquitin-protein ligase APD2-like [Humulus lupulus]|uniref:E3 ubiquitin-protein ligase APD2-like n=1 Tax=Humulus lupulus TaxID=3486 RepID=UPI002B40C3D8|nr:E3 ubiquitin-protein ligase APD2-like [Humulus lupulus]XP_062074249.1 E3 ubiquitin-protein ligase APD2-like [Humulus lupulus]
MCSIINGISHRKLQHFIVSISRGTSSSNNDPEWCATVDFATRLVAYITVILALVVIVILIILRLVEEVVFNQNGREDHDHDYGESFTTETNSLIIRAEKQVHYGTINTPTSCDEADNNSNNNVYVEIGSCSNSNGNSSSNGIGCCSEELYDGKVCVICYDQSRNCFFVPCGHSATCYICAQRIFNGETKTCPVCRRFIRKVRKLFAI